MTGDVHLATVLYADSTAGRFVVLRSSHEEVIIYSHWRVFKDAGFPLVQPGQRFEVRIELDEKDDQTPVVSRVLKMVDDFSSKTDGVVGRKGGSTQSLSASELRSRRSDGRDGFVIVSNENIEECEFRCFSSPASIVFVDCRFEGNFRLLDACIRGGLWFLNCTFKYHFSLKGTRLHGNAVLFGCDFSGFGGVSFRGLRGRSIFLEYGVRGGEDMIWLNELSLSGCVAISGTFTKRRELLARQDDSPVNLEPGLYRVLIGRSDYSHESLSENQFLGGVECRNYELQRGFEVHNSVVADLLLDHVHTNYVSIDKCQSNRDVVLDSVHPRDEKKGIAITNSVVERHLRITGHSLRGCVNLSDTSVGQTWTLRFDAPSSGVPRVRLYRFYAGAAQFEPIELVYGASGRRRLLALAPPVFGLLEGAEVSGKLGAERRRELSEAYTSCKNWLATSGHLLEEDHAFFHMRNAKEPIWLKRCLFGGVFGWGIHLWNILISTAVLIALFALVYTCLGAGSFPEMTIFSSQAFISSFFGEWPEYRPDGILSLLVTLESMLGVLFITVLVGAYIRKLLR